MRRSVLVVVIGAIAIGAVVFTLEQGQRKSELHSTSSLTPSPGAPPRTEQDPQTEIQTAIDSPESDRTQTSPETHSDGVVVPIPLPREFDLVSPDEKYWHRNTVLQLHAQMEREPIDPAWSRSGEEEVMRAITSNQQIVQRGMPTVHCRAKTCEVQMVVYGANDDEGKWSEYFGNTYKKLRSGFELQELSVAHEGGVTTLALFLSKRK